MNDTEKEFKEIMENAGWIVCKINGDSNLSSEIIPHKVLNFVTALKDLFGNKGLPDFFIMKDTLVNGFFVEVKYKSQLSTEQIEQITLLKKYLNVVSYLVVFNERGNLEFAKVGR